MGEERNNLLHSDWFAEKQPLGAEVLSLLQVQVDGH